MQIRAEYGCALALLGAAVLCGCGGESTAVPTSKPKPVVAAQPAAPVVDASVEVTPAVVEVTAAVVATEGHPTLVETLSAARCQRELRCGNVGEGKKHGSLTRCRAELAASFRDELNRYRCDTEIVREGLTVCMQDIQQGDCSKPLAPLKAVASCKLSLLCAKR